MKRYRVCSFEFDSRAKELEMKIEDSWDDKTKEMWKNNKQQIIKSLIIEYGQFNIDAKIQNFIELGPKPFSVISYHNNLLNQIRNSYILSSYYPSMTAVCSLGERILNHFILDLRSDYIRFKSENERHHPCIDCDKYEDIKKQGIFKDTFDIYTCKACSNWNLMIKTLTTWGIFNPDVESLYYQLHKYRVKSIHFVKASNFDIKQQSLCAILIFQDIIRKLFGAIGKDIFIKHKGEMYLKKEVESAPFIKKYYIPNCLHVSPYHPTLTVGGFDDLR